LPYYSASNFFGFSPALISSDSTVGNVTAGVFGGMPQFWFAGSYTQNGKTYFVVDTSVSTLRQSNITVSTNTITITSVSVNGVADNNFNNWPDTTGALQSTEIATPWTGINAMTPIVSDITSSA